MAGKKMQKVVRWRKVLVAMGACDFLSKAFEYAGKPATLDGMFAWMQASDDRLERLTREHVVGILEVNGLALDGLGGDGRWVGFDPGGWIWERPFTQTQLGNFKRILERESDARGLTEWI